MDDQVLTTTNEAAIAGGVIGALMATLGIFVFVIAAAWYILQVIAYWKIFTKAGKPGWHSIIPFLNTWDEIDLSWNSTIAWVAIALVIVTSVLSSPAQAENASTFLKVIFYVLVIATSIITIISEYKLAKAFGKGVGFFIGLLLLNPIFKLILGFGSATYQGRQG